MPCAKHILLCHAMPCYCWCKHAMLAIRAMPCHAMPCWPDQSFTCLSPYGLNSNSCHASPCPTLHRLHPAAEVGTGMGFAATALPALLVMLLGSRTAALYTGDAAVIQACGPLILPLATTMLSECRWGSVGWCGLDGMGFPVHGCPTCLHVCCFLLMCHARPPSGTHCTQLTARPHCWAAFCAAAGGRRLGQS